MASIKKLPDAEFEIMKIIWRNPSPITTLQIMGKLSPGRNWKPQTVLTLLVRLIDKGYLSSSKAGKERIYAPIISSEEYLAIETENFLSRFHSSSVLSLMSMLYDGKKLSDQEIDELRTWLNERERKP